jgi:hypothetical protein
VLKLFAEELMTEEQPPPSSRDAFNRLLGLSAYAGGVCVLGFVAFSIWDEGKLPSIQELAGILAVLFVFFGLGYSTSRKRLG